ncbi:hypothetical protein B0H14DRAFT_3878631 [Mycena olivaceomarginata]|nr:hypothetical protein B0H14DRAFT_3878631 [Mycena olivaceomarginata]
MVELAEKIVDTAAMRHPPEGWTAPVLGPRGNDKRTSRIIQTVASTASSMEKTEFELFGEAQAVGMGDWTEEDDNSGEMFAPGTFVELRRNERATHGVVLGEVAKDNRKHVMALITTGEVWDPLRDDIMLPSRLSLHPTSRDGVLRWKSRWKKANSTRASKTRMADILRSGVDIYSIVKSRDPNEWATTTVAEVARLFTPKPTLVTVFATPQVSHGEGRVLRGRPWIHSLAIVQSSACIPHFDHQVCFRSGVASHRDPSKISPNARSRFLRRTGACVPNIGMVFQRSDPPSIRGRPKDIVILTFLHQALQPMRSIQTDPYSIGQSAIIHALDPMQRGGRPRNAYDTHRPRGLRPKTPPRPPKPRPPRPSSNAPSRRRPVAGPWGRRTSTPRTRWTISGHDFGDTPIYVIDDANAQELDDGVSVEPVAGEPDASGCTSTSQDPGVDDSRPRMSWRSAQQKQSQTAYFLHRTWPLFPKSCDVLRPRGGSRSRTKTENRVLTFSSKVNAEGALVGVSCGRGIARNFVKLSVAPPPPPKPKLPARQLEDLRTLTMLQEPPHTVSVHPGDNRAKRGGSELEGLCRAAAHRQPNHAPPASSSGSPSSRILLRSPTTPCGRLARADHGGDEARRAAPRRGGAPSAASTPSARGASPLTGAPGALEKLRAMRERPSATSNSRNCRNLADGRCPSRPTPWNPPAHWTLAVPEGEGYTRATSPLRRAPFSRATRTETLHQRFWCSSHLKRWLEAPNRNIDDPLADLHAITMRTLRVNFLTNRLQSEVRIPGLGIAASLEDVDQKHTANWELARSLPVKIDDIKLGLFLLRTAPLAHVSYGAPATLSGGANGPEAYPQAQGASDVGDHPIKNVWEDKLVPSVFAVLRSCRSTGQVWTSCVSLTSMKPNGPSGSLDRRYSLFSLSRRRHPRLGARCLALFAEHQLADVEVHVRESLLVRQNGPKLMKLAFLYVHGIRPPLKALEVSSSEKGGSTKSTGVCGKEDDADISYVTPGTWLLKDIAEHGIEEPNVIAGPELVC